MPTPRAFTPVPAETVLNQLNWRAAIKKFDPARTIDAATWAALERAVVLSPSGSGLQPWKFVIVTDPALRAQLRTVAYSQPQITDASHLVVFCRRTNMVAADIERFIQRTAEVRGVSLESLEGFKNSSIKTVTARTEEGNTNWAARQCYIALGIFLSAAAMMGVDACPMEGFTPDEFDKILGLTEQGYASTVLATAGYRAADDPFASLPKVRFLAEQVIQHR